MWCGFDFLRIFLTFAGNMTIGIAIIGIIEIAANYQSDSTKEKITSIK